MFSSKSQLESELKYSQIVEPFPLTRKPSNQSVIEGLNCHVSVTDFAPHFCGPPCVCSTDAGLHPVHYMQVYTEYAKEQEQCVLIFNCVLHEAPTVTVSLDQPPPSSLIFVTVYCDPESLLIVEVHM